jgi:GNAT superfamily N-acetyltransferase
MVIVRAVRPEDFEQWADLYRDYRAFYRLVPDEVVVECVWSWVLDDEHEVNALIADDEGRLVGLAHHRRFARPSSGTIGLYLDDLFTLPAYRGRGVGRALLGALADLAEAEGLSVVRWITAEDNAQARRLYDAVATATHWVTYDLLPGPIPGPKAG